MFNNLFNNIRFYILLFSFSFSLAVYIYITTTVPEGYLQVIKLTQIYALTAVTFLYFTLLASPLTRAFTFLPFRGKYLKSRRALGVSVTYFGLLHAYFAFFHQLGGFAGLGFLDNKYLLAITLSTSALIILVTMAATANEFMVSKLSFPKWKMLHRFVYLAAVFLLIHALMLGTHFQDLSGMIPQIFTVALAILLILEAIRIDNYLQDKFINLPKIGFTLLLVIAAILIYFFSFFFSETPIISLGIHSAHIQLAKQAQQNSYNLPSNLNIPGLQGDRTRRFTVSFLHPDNITSNTNTPLNFQVYDANSGNKVSLFQRVYEKVNHLIIVDEQLKYFSHIHPDQTTGGFNIITQFPQPGRYHLYTSFQPLGAIEQQFGFTLDVEKVDQPVITFQPENNLTKTFGKYEVSLSFPKPLKASELSIGNQKLTFTLKDAITKEPIANLKPYLASFGHLVMINTKTFDYLHVHPSNLVAPKTDENGGPVVEFLPLGIYGPIKPGVYKVFAQFNPDNNLMLTDFTINVE